MRTKKNEEILRIRIPKEIKEEFRKYCDENLIDMSVETRQLILKKLKEVNGNNRNN